MVDVKEGERPLHKSVGYDRILVLLHIYFIKTIFFYFFLTFLLNVKYINGIYKK